MYVFPSGHAVGHVAPQSEVGVEPSGHVVLHGSPLGLEVPPPNQLKNQFNHEKLDWLLYAYHKNKATNKELQQHRATTTSNVVWPPLFPPELFPKRSPMRRACDWRRFFYKQILV